jgi:hypothetical protein
MNKKKKSHTRKNLKRRRRKKINIQNRIRIVMAAGNVGKRRKKINIQDRIRIVMAAGNVGKRRKKINIQNRIQRVTGNGEKRRTTTHQMEQSLLTLLILKERTNGLVLCHFIRKLRRKNLILVMRIMLRVWCHRKGICVGTESGGGMMILNMKIGILGVRSIGVMEERTGDMGKKIERIEGGIGMTLIDMAVIAKIKVGVEVESGIGKAGVETGIGGIGAGVLVKRGIEGKIVRGTGFKVGVLVERGTGVKTLKSTEDKL